MPLLKTRQVSCDSDAAPAPAHKKGPSKKSRAEIFEQLRTSPGWVANAMHTAKLSIRVRGGGWLPPPVSDEKVRLSPMLLLYWFRTRASSSTNTRTASQPDARTSTHAKVVRRTCQVFLKELPSGPWRRACADGVE